MLYIAPVAQRGGSLSLLHFQTFFLKNRFLSDYVVPACPKYISGKLRNFSKNFSKIFFIPHFLKIFCQQRKCRCCSKSACPGAGNTPKSLHDPKNQFFSKSEISIPQSNHGKRNIKLMLVRP